MTQAVLDTAPATAADRKSADVRAALTFITRSDAKPVFHSAAYTGGAPRVFFDTERHSVPIRDLRPLAGALSLEREGFELRRHRDRRARSVRRRRARAGLLPGDRGAAARGRRCQPRRRVRRHPALRRWRRRQEPGGPARPGQPGARGLHREERPAAGEGSHGRGGSRAPCRIRRPDHPDQRMAADPRAGRALAACPGGCRERAARGPDRDRPGVPRPGRRDLPPRPSTRRSAGTMRPG